MRLVDVISLDLEVLPSNLRGSSKLARKAQLSLLLSFMQQEIELIGVDSIPATSLLKLLTIDDLLDGDLFGKGEEEDASREHAKRNVLSHFTQELDGMVEVNSSFNYDQCIDLINLVSTEEGVQSDFWSVILAIFGQKANKKSFFLGRRIGPTLADTKLILSKIGAPTDISKENWKGMSQVLQYLTQKSLNSAESEIENKT